MHPAPPYRLCYSYDGANRLNSDSVYTYSYDNNGNLTTRTRRSDNAQSTYTYDVRNQLTQVVTEGGVTASYGYDVAGRRSWKTIAKGTTTYVAEHYVYNGDDIVAVTDQTGNVRSVYTHGPGVDEPLMLQRGTSVYFLLADGLGSIMAVADNAGNVVERVAYQAYGKPVFENVVTGSTASWSAAGNRYSYTGREYESATGLYYYRARWYDAETGRFTQKDPIGFDSGDVNLYVYVADNPLAWVDPYGLAEIKISLSDSTLVVYDDKGIELLKANIIHGCPDTKTPVGKFKLDSWKSSHTSPIWGKDSQTKWDKSFWGYNVFGPWFVPLINGDGVAIHGTVGPKIPFFWYRYLPTRYGSCSHGCIRMTNTDVIKLHDLLPKIEGTRVTISK